MRISKIIVALLVSVVAVTAMTGVVAGDDGELVLPQAIVGFESGLTEDDQNKLVADYGGMVVGRITALNCVIVEVERIPMFKAGISEEDEVVYAEDNAVIEAVFTPNDSNYSQQWGLANIKADEAWDCEQGSSDIKIAVLDTGIDYNHADLDDNYVSGGWDWVNGDSEPLDGNGHGTNCAGIIAAEINNDIGIAGIAQVSIMAEKVLDDDGKGTYWDTAIGVVHAADAGADVISMSLGGKYNSRTLENACQYALDNGCVLVAAAGNDGEKGPDQIRYPSRYDTVICVGAIDSSNQRASFSNYGSQMELVAPGVNVLSTNLGGGYVTFSGTSPATAHVSGVAGLIWSEDSGLTNLQVRETMKSTADDLGLAGWDAEYGYGRVNATGYVCSGSNPDPIPEFATIAIPAIAVLGLFLFFNKRKHKKD